MGGRQRHSDLPQSSKHSLLVPKRCHLDKLICQHYHSLSLHSGTRTNQSLINGRYWIIGLRSILRHLSFNCSTCFKLRSKTFKPIMTDLPPSRVNILRAFLNTGVKFTSKISHHESLIGFVRLHVHQSGALGTRFSSFHLFFLRLWKKISWAFLPNLKLLKTVSYPKTKKYAIVHG
ncbi:hypothetical protein AAG570_008024 [Ranatra chinensis]|uniref:Uncharacterized protein n=1 Tax=Ranatra chinensis TaxID=642074 RepID=A0ABD0XTJ6_9HEMI